MTHWVDFLPEVGRPTEKLGEEQMAISRQISDLQREIARLERVHAEGKAALLAHVKQFWTDDEISTAEKEWGASFR